MIRNFAPVKYDIVPLAGGLDQITPALSLRPGFARRASNWECDITGGYTRIAGYERFDGRARPSDAQFAAVGVSSVAGFTVGQTLTSAGVTSKLIAIDGLSLIVTRLASQYTAGASISNGTATTTITNFSQVLADGEKDALYQHLAANDYRADIGLVPGSGAILGVAHYNGKVYAWRNNAGGTAAVMYGSSATGWQAVPLFEEVGFTNATAALVEGSTITQGAVTAVVRRVVLRTGALGTNPNSGSIVISGRAGGNFAAGAINIAATAALTASGVQTQIAFLPGGKFNAVVANFGGGSANRRLYVADGVNRAFEFDGTVLAPISTGMSPDKPGLAVVHKQHLFLSFGSSLQFSSIGKPYSWSPILGAGEISMDEDITGIVQLPGDQTNGALAIYTKNKTSILYGSSSANFSLSVFNTSTGAFFGSTQNLEQTYFMTEQGVSSLSASQNFGNFTPATLTTALQPYIKEHYRLTSASGISRDRGQYRVFFSDGYGLYMTVRNGQYIGAMPVQFTDPVLCLCEGERADGSKTSYFGSSNGYVYEMDVGTSFDGQDIPSSFTLVFNATGNARVLKRYRKASIEVYGRAYNEFFVGYDLGYRSPQLEQPLDAEYMRDLRASYWDSFNWERFVWDGAEISPSEIEMAGTAENIAVRVSSVSAIYRPFTINSVTIHFTPRRGIR